MRKPRSIVAYGPDAVLLRWEAVIDPEVNLAVRAYAAALESHEGVVECVVAYADLLVCFAPGRYAPYRMREICYAASPTLPQAGEGTTHVVPVRYGGEYGPDAETVCAELGIDVARLIELHAGRDYTVYQLGYQPGFAFLGPTHERLRIARLPTPRPSVRAGSVGLAGAQTGIYPTEGPGGWRLIGRTPLTGGPQDVTRLWRAGDRVRFEAVDEATMTKLETERSTAEELSLEETLAPSLVSPKSKNELRLTALTNSPTTLVDAGRAGMRAEAYPLGGPADLDSALLAREMLASPPGGPLLEFAHYPGKWLLRGKGSFVLTGADFGWRLNGRPIRRYRVQQLDGDEAVLTGRMPENGARAYLNVAGEWRLPRTAGSVEATRVAYLEKEWTVEIATQVRPASKFPIPDFELPDVVELDVLPGPEWQHLTSRQQSDLLATVWAVGTASTRQGLHLQNDAYASPTLPEMLSSPTLPGTVQLTPRGPILLGPQAHTVGGYARVLCLASRAMLDVAYQTPLGHRVKLRLA